MRGCARVAAAAFLALLGWGCAAEPAGNAGVGGGGQLEVAGTVSARLEGRLSGNEELREWLDGFHREWLDRFQSQLGGSASGELPDSVAWWIRHLDVRSDGFSVVGESFGSGGFVVVGGLDLELAQVVGRPRSELVGMREGPVEHPPSPIASRVAGGRLFVMDDLWRGSVWAYPMGSGDGGGFGAVGELVVEIDLWDGPEEFGFGTDFAVRADGSIVAPVHEGPTYLGVVWPPRDSVAAGPAWDTRADAGEFGQLFRYWHRVAGLENGGLLVWDDYSAVVIVAAADGTESRWSLPEEYRRTGLPEMRPRYGQGSSVSVDLGTPTMAGWTAVDGSVCMAVRPVVVDEVEWLPPVDAGFAMDLLWLDLGGTGELPELRRIDLNGPADGGDAVSCGIVGDVLLVATGSDVLRYRLEAEAESPE